MRKGAFRPRVPPVAAATPELQVVNGSTTVTRVHEGGTLQWPSPVKKAILWRREVDNSPGMLASILQPLSEVSADLQVVMAYRYPSGENKAAIELYPVSGRKSAAAAQTAGLAPSSISTLVVEGDNRPGLGHAIAKAVGDAGINMSFVMAQVVGRRYS